MLVQGLPQPGWATDDIAEQDFGARRVVDTRAVYTFMVTQLFCMIYLAKFAVPVPGVTPVSVPLLAMVAGLAIMGARGQLWMAPRSLLLFAIFAAAACFAHAVTRTPYSLPSLLLLLMFTFQQIFTWQVATAFYERVMGVFLKLMIVPALMVFAQLLSQLVFGLGHQPNLEKLVPAWMLLPGYVYEAPIRWGASFVRPNGFFMVEPSSVSAMLAIAILVEAQHFRRPSRLLLFFAAMIGSVGATGMVLLLVAAPFLIIRRSPQFFLWLTGLALAAVVVLAPLGAFNAITGRLDELNARRSSGSERLVMPLQQLGVVLADPTFLIAGAGAGNLDPKQAGNGWPVVKVATEYGLLAAILYLALFLSGLWRGPNLPLKVGLFVIFQLTGGYLLFPIMNEVVVLLVMIMSPAAPEQPALAAREAAGRDLVPA